MGPDKALRAPGFAFSAEVEAEAAEAEAACLEAAEAEACIESAAGQNSTTIVHLPRQGTRCGRQQPCPKGAHV